MPASLNCPTCGAPAPSADAARCVYCGSTLSTIACPSCMGAMFAGMEYCPTCGAKAARATVDDQSVLSCPGCTSDMHLVHVGDTEMYECAACASVWVAGAQFRQLCATHESRGAVAAFLDSTVAPGVSGAMPSPKPDTLVRYVPCPMCRRVMNRQNFGYRSGIVIDVCKEHGAWFEHNELRDALAFIDSGGFERARLEHERAQLESQVKLLRDFAASGEALHSMAASRSDADAVPLQHSDVEAALAQALRSLFS